MPSLVSKSHEANGDPVVTYTANLTTKLHPLQKELHEKTLSEAPMSGMLGAPEVLMIGQSFINLINGKRVLDIGTYTGASALAWALAIPEDGKIYTLDINHGNFKRFGEHILRKCSKTFAKIEAVEGPALQFLDKLLAQGKKGTFDFAFIDADKVNYSNYYDRCVQLLRKGGVILVDNALWDGRVVDFDPATATKDTIAIDKCNKEIFADQRTDSFLINTGDGLHVAFKK